MTTFRPCLLVSSAIASSKTNDLPLPGSPTRSVIFPRGILNRSSGNHSIVLLSNSDNGLWLTVFIFHPLLLLRPPHPAPLVRICAPRPRPSLSSNNPSGCPEPPKQSVH